MLNATANVPGKFTYSPAVGSTLPSGTQKLFASFTPDDSVNFEATVMTVDIVVNPTLATTTGTTTSQSKLIVALIDGSKKFSATSALQAQFKSWLSSNKKATSVNVWSFVTPTGDAAKDLAVAKANLAILKPYLTKLAPKLKIVLKPSGSATQKLCSKSSNSCIIFSS
jgi:hypothetical protein